MSFTQAAQSLKPGVAFPTLPRPDQNSIPPKFEFPTAYVELKLVQWTHTVPHSVKIVYLYKLCYVSSFAYHYIGINKQLYQRYFYN